MVKLKDFEYIIIEKLKDKWGTLEGVVIRGENGREAKTPRAKTIEEWKKVSEGYLEWYLKDFSAMEFSDWEGDNISYLYEVWLTKEEKENENN